MLENNCARLQKGVVQGGIEGLKVYYFDESGGQCNGLAMEKGAKIGSLGERYRMNLSLFRPDQG